MLSFVIAFYLTSQAGQLGHLPGGFSFLTREMGIRIFAYLPKTILRGAKETIRGNHVIAGRELGGGQDRQTGFGLGC